MIRQQQRGVVFYQFEGLSDCRAVLHAVFTRIGGTSGGCFHSLNVGQLVGDEPAAVQANHDLICQVLGVQAGQVVTARQVHGAQVAVVDAADRGPVIAATDSLISRERGVALLLRFADCLPLMLYDPQHRAIGLVHVGWRGWLAGVVPNTLSAMRDSFGSRPQSIVAGLGPAIGPCCYKVGPDLIAGVTQACDSVEGLFHALPDGSVHFDLPAAVRKQLRQAGVHSIESSALCTCCHTDQFFSHRGEGGRTGRFAAVLALRA